MFKVGQRVRVINVEIRMGSCPVPLGTLGTVVRELQSNSTLATLRVDYDGYPRKFVAQYPWRLAPATPEDPHVDTDF